MSNNVQPHLSIVGNVVRKEHPYQPPSLAPLEATTVYDTYWRFAAERQAIFFARLNGSTQPWTNDPILRQYKFTNVYRATDRTTQFLIKNVIYAGPSAVSDIVFRTLLFKIFNKIETWQLLEDRLGRICWQDYSFSMYDQVLTDAFEAGTSIYSGAYIMPSPRQYDYKRKHRNHLRLIETMMKENVPARLADCRRMQDGFEVLRSYPSIGDFLAYQYIIDINYSPMIDFSENEFVIPGPGARSGIQKCFSNLGGLNEVEVIQMMVDRQDEEFSRLGLDFRTLFGRQLKLIDCQNIFCEVDKYARVAHPEIRGLSDRRNIKQTFAPTGSPPSYWFPPKWRLVAERSTDIGGMTTERDQDATI